MLALGAIAASIVAACAAGGGTGSDDDGPETSSSTGGSGTGGAGATGTGTTVGTGGMGTGGTGTGSLCEEDPCKLVAPQCGCAPGEKCQWDNDMRSCMADGTADEGESCGSCKAGMLCVAIGTFGTCKRYCNTDAECSAGPGSICLLQIGSYEQKWCTDNCDPVSGAGCPSSGKCELGQSEDPPMPYFTVCTPSGAGQQGSPCTDFTDCAAGLSCLTNPNTMTDQCLTWCQVSQGLCPTNTACTPFQTPATVGSIEYGVCI
jgi:hypothetical protein